MKIAIITNVVPEYRRAFYKYVSCVKEHEVTIFCVDKINNSNLKSIHSQLPINVFVTPSFQINGETIVIQKLPLKAIAKSYDVVFIDGNPRYLSMVVLGLYLGLKKKNIVLWTMARSYRNNRITGWLRLQWAKWFRCLFLYTDEEIHLLRRAGFTQQHMIGMNNGLDQTNIDRISGCWRYEKLVNFKEEHQINGKTLLISCARLIKKNKFETIPKIIKSLKNKIPSIYWIIIGDGEMRQEIENQISDLGIKDYVKFLGSIYNEEELAPWFLVSSILLHPSAIGLTLMHAFGYGVPVITHNNLEEHGPEIAAFVDGETGLFYKQNDYSDMEMKVEILLNSRVKLDEMRKKCLAQVHDKYNSYSMAQRFFSIAKIAYKK
jgi:glycosyltransferase involved in cell wall biosynthesis